MKASGPTAGDKPGTAAAAVGIPGEGWSLKLRAVDQLAAEYAAALQEYLSGGGEVSLRRAYELGRRALQQGLGALDVVAAYQRCALQPGGGGGAATPEFARAMSFLAESLSPFEMILRGYQETNDGLRRRLDEVIRAQSQLSEQNEGLLAVKRAIEDERQRYRKLLDLGPEACLITDLDGVIREANTQAASLLYLPRQTLEGRHLSDFVDREQRDALQRQLGQLVAADSEARSEWRVNLRRADSTVVRIDLSVRVGTEGWGGGISDLLWVLRRVPKRSRRSEPAPGPAPAGSGGAESSDLLARASSVLLSSLDYEPALEEVARLAVPHLADLFFVHVLEPDGSIKQLKAACTSAAAELFADETERKSLLSPVVRSRPLACLRSRTIEVLEQVTDDWIWQLADDADQFRALKKVGARSAVVAPMFRNDQPLGVFTLLRLPSSQEAGHTDLALIEDLVRRCAFTVVRVRLSREAAAARSSAERASIAKDEFLAILSHELRNPLMSVLAWARILNSRKRIREEAVLSEGVQSIERNARHLARLADDCLDLVRISHGKFNVVKTRVDLNQVVLSSAEAVREMALSKRLEQAVVLSAEPLWLMGDATRLEQAVVNLLVNAVKYTESNGRVVISSLRQDAWAEVQVRDNGIGIPPDQIETIFEPFRKGTSEWATSGSGLGLGLAIAREIVEMHGGAIRVESQGAGYGSCFRIQLPLAGPADAEPAPERRNEQVEPAGTALRVLVVEDSKDLLFLLKLELESLGHSVLTANDGASGLELALRERPDVLITDIKIPVIDGYELIRRLRSQPQTADIPAIALTALNTKTHVEKALSLGFDACLDKTSAIEELNSEIARLAASRPRRQGSPVVK